VKVIEEPQLAVKRKLPWLIDMLLYPMSVSGIIHLLVFLLLPWLLSLFVNFLMRLVPKDVRFGAGYVIGWLYLPFYVVFYGYVAYYIIECVISSSRGGYRAPDPSIPETLDWRDLVGQMLLLVSCVAICFWPTAVYYILAEQTGRTFWLLLSCGMFFFPMALLRGIMFDSYDALNPMLIISSIAGTFLPYCGLVLIFILLGGFVGIILPKLAVWDIVGDCVNIYLVFVLANFLGWFYWWHKDKLDWGL
jgi:hypothetical protein